MLQNSIKEQMSKWNCEHLQCKWSGKYTKQCFYKSSGWFKYLLTSYWTIPLLNIIENITVSCLELKIGIPK